MVIPYIKMILCDKLIASGNQKQIDPHSKIAGCAQTVEDGSEENSQI